ncbi:folate-binding protein YgfZ [Oxalobacteraceae bacterium GrIS 2.11]
MSIQTSSSFAEAGFAQLSQFALITASGADAAGFLHSQLTSDIKSLEADHASLAGLCSPKGRLLATMLVWKNNDTITIEVPLELQESLQKRLQMYVMRAKVVLENVTAAQSVFGIFGAAAVQQLAQWFPIVPAHPHELISNEAGALLRVADVEGMERYQWITSKEFAAQIETKLAALLTRVPENAWAMSEIHAGIPHVTLATQEKFVPQMINYELIGGVNFKKGCYPGQEIVARTHYLGKQKRRTVLAHIPSNSVASGMEVFASSDLEQPCGMVVNAALNNAGGSDCLIEIKTAVLADTVVQLSSGEVCQWLPMPYSLPTETAQST